MLEIGIHFNIVKSLLIICSHHVFFEEFLIGNDNIIYFPVNNENYTFLSKKNFQPFNHT